MLSLVLGFLLAFSLSFHIPSNKKGTGTSVTVNRTKKPDTAVIVRDIIPLTVATAPLEHGNLLGESKGFKAQDNVNRVISIKVGDETTTEKYVLEFKFDIWKMAIQDTRRDKRVYDHDNRCVYFGYKLLDTIRVGLEEREIRTTEVPCYVYQRRISNVSYHPDKQVFAFDKVLQPPASGLQDLPFKTDIHKAMRVLRQKSLQPVRSGDTLSVLVPMRRYKIGNEYPLLLELFFEEGELYSYRVVFAKHAGQHSTKTDLEWVSELFTVGFGEPMSSDYIRPGLESAVLSSWSGVHYNAQVALESDGESFRVTGEVTMDRYGI